ncbi:MAG: 2,3,4,5-tetrahydropyridine-2,6-dicarboxylate N-succinyltransferase, partial [Chryseobacterium sp.]|nr:2,3,4,5-tetrahydropyridine-2,6-dicarboxylate N-succinyltransferase [Chryseobacterium sp.]
MSLQEKIEKAWDNRELLNGKEYQDAVREVVALL